jgi:hypothetical protein
VAFQIQGFPRLSGFQALQRVFDFNAPNPLAYPAKRCWRVVLGGSGGIAGFGCLCRRHVKRFFVFFWLNRLLDVFESSLHFDSYAQQVLRFRVLVL